MYFILYIFPGVVYFLPGRKNPLLIFENHRYKLMGKSGGQTVWRCSSIRDKSCSTRIFTHGKTITVVCEPHVHPPPLMEISETTPKIVVQVKRSVS